MLFTTAAEQIPLWRVSEALKKGREKHLLFLAGGGLGDQICAEPTIRYALDHFKDCKISVLTHTPDLFRHLTPRLEFLFERGRWTDAQIDLEKYLCLRTYASADDFSGQFMSSIITHCVDYPAMLSLRGQLPIEYREPVVEPLAPEKRLIPLFQSVSVAKSWHEAHHVYVHPGRGWPSKTFGSAFWSEVISKLVKFGATPVIIGNDTAWVEVSKECVDLRDKLSVMETIWLLQHCRVLLTNDSAPLHMAATKASKAWIGFVATCKRADYLYHFRRGKFGWRMKNFSKGGVWNLLDFAPNKQETVDVKNVDEKILETWLPNPKDFAKWATGRWRYVW
jgi:Glycosyltransferase family 9 (heptosyltransferase)